MDNLFIDTGNDLSLKNFNKNNGSLPPLCTVYGVWKCQNQLFTMALGLNNLGDV